jgi:hypothetical protein
VGTLPTQGEEMNQAHARPARRTNQRFSKVADARTTIAGFGKGMDICGLTYGQFSMLDLLEAALEITGPADVVVSTWSAGFYDMNAAVKFRDSGRLKSIRFLMDSSAKRGQATAGNVIDLFGLDSVRTTRSHAKFALITNIEWSVVITSSMNLNLNPRVEQFEMTDDAARMAMFMEFVDSCWGELPEGETGDRTLPKAAGMQAVEKQSSIQFGKAPRIGP